MLHQILNRVPSKALTLFTRQMSAMLSAGLPLSKSLATLSKQTESKNLKKNLEAITFEVQGGSSFAEALRKKEVFPELYCGMVAAGEASGTLDAILKKPALSSIVLLFPCPLWAIWRKKRQFPGLPVPLAAS